MAAAIVNNKGRIFFLHGRIGGEGLKKNRLKVHPLMNTPIIKRIKGLIRFGSCSFKGSIVSVLFLLNPI